MFFFNIKTKRGYDLSPFSCYPEVPAVIIVPPVQFLVTDVINSNGEFLIYLEDIESFPIDYFPLHQPLNTPTNIQDCYEEFEKGMDHYIKCKYNDAIKSFQICSKYNYPPAFLMLGFLYSGGGRIGPVDVIKKNYWFSLAQKHSSFFKEVLSPPSLVFCSGHYFTFVENDHQEAFKFYKISAEQGYAPAQSNIGFSYFNGEGVTKDLTKAIQYYQLASDQGHAGAQNNLAICYQNGDGLSKDLSKAIEYYHKAADQGHAGAQYNLANCYRFGDGVPRDIARSIEYYHKSAHQGDEFSLKRLSYFIYDVLL